jgi:DNA-binding response OmpR family regulator
LTFRESLHTAHISYGHAACNRDTGQAMPMLDLPDYEQELMRVMSELLNDLEVDGAPADVAKRISTVLLVEDEVRLAALISSHLRELKLGVRIEHDGESGLAAALEEAFDLIILDVVLPGLDGFAICREVRRRKLTTPIMMLSARGVTEDRVRGLDSGADDYLTKPFDFAELIARVRALLRRQLPGASMAISIGDLRLDPVARLVHRGSRKVDLTQKEFALLEYFMRNADQVLTRAMIGEQVWDFTWDRMTNVIDVYVNHLRRKLEDAGEARVIHAVRGVGYVLRSSEHGDDQDA